MRLELWSLRYYLLARSTYFLLFNVPTPWGWKANNCNERLWCKICKAKGGRVHFSFSSDSSWGIWSSIYIYICNDQTPCFTASRGCGTTVTQAAMWPENFLVAPDLCSSSPFNSFFGNSCLVLNAFLSGIASWLLFLILDLDWHKGFGRWIGVQQVNRGRKTHSIMPKANRMSKLMEAMKHQDMLKWIKIGHHCWSVRRWEDRKWSCQVKKKRLWSKVWLFWRESPGKHVD